MDDPSTPFEWVIRIIGALFGLALLVAVVNVVWSYVLAPASRLRSRLVKGRPPEEEPPAPSRPAWASSFDEPRLPLTKDDFLAELGGRRLLYEDLVGRLASRAAEVMRRRPGDKAVNEWASELVTTILARWEKANGDVPRALRDFPPEAWLFPETWKTGNVAESFAAEWNERDWHHDERLGPVTPDELRAAGRMTPQEFVDWSVDVWAVELDSELSLGCLDVVVLPLFFVVLAGGGLSSAGLNEWLAFALAIVALAPFMVVWRWVRRRGYISWGDDGD
jgi:hypothetical protein